MADVKAILGEKLGMTQIFEEARAVPVTIVKAGPCAVGQIKSEKVDGYEAIQLVFGDIKENKVTKPLKGHFDSLGLEPGNDIVELRTDDAASYTSGQVLTCDIFEAGQRVDVVGVSKGKGFAGSMKRHGFHGMGASHGAEKVHRSPGSIGNAATPSRVFKGRRMAGHMGHERVTILNLEVVRADVERNLLLIKGAIPGPVGTLVMVRTAVKGKVKA